MDSREGYTINLDGLLERSRLLLPERCDELSAGWFDHLIAYFGGHNNRESSDDFWRMIPLVDTTLPIEPTSDELLLPAVSVDSAVVMKMPSCSSCKRKL